MGTRVYIEEGGCDRRQLDAATIRRYLGANDYELVDDPSDADRILVVTCAFKRKEEEESLGRLRSLRKYGRDIVVYGCLPEIASERFAEFSDLPAVSPSELETIGEYFKPTTVAFSEVPAANTIEAAGSGMVRARRKLEAGALTWRDLADKVRAIPARLSGEASHGAPFNLFVCRGCMGKCSYCAIKKAIKGVRSKTTQEVIAEFRSGLIGGHRTFHILGDDPGCYGLDHSSSLPELMTALFEESDAHASRTPAAPDGEQPVRFHIREIHPKYLVRYCDEFIGLPRFDRVSSILCPVQSGSDRVLRLMRREHTADELLGAIGRIRRGHPSVEVTTQMIVGFPTETASEFEETLHFVRDAAFDSVVVFPYDKKPGTAAAQLEGEISVREIDDRMREAFRFFRREGILAYDSCPQ